MSFWSIVLLVLAAFFLFMTYWFGSFIKGYQMRPWGTVPLLYVPTGSYYNVVPGVARDGRTLGSKLIYEKKSFFGGAKPVSLSGNVEWLHDEQGRVVGGLAPADYVLDSLSRDIKFVFEARDRLSAENNSLRAKLRELEKESVSERDDRAVRLAALGSQRKEAKK